jgi:hypothetical protein
MANLCESEYVGFTGRPSGYRRNRESTALPLQYCHLFKQSDEKPSEESVFGNPNYRLPGEREVESDHAMRLLRYNLGNPETEYVQAYPTALPLNSTGFSLR